MDDPGSTAWSARQPRFSLFFTRQGPQETSQSPTFLRRKLWQKILGLLSSDVSKVLVKFIQTLTREYSKSLAGLSGTKASAVVSSIWGCDDAVVEKRKNTRVKVVADLQGFGGSPFTRRLGMSGHQLVDLALPCRICDSSPLFLESAQGRGRISQRKTEYSVRKTNISVLLCMEYKV